MPRPHPFPIHALLLATALLLAGPAAHAARDPMKQTFLQPAKGVQLATYRGAVVVLQPTTIEADKDKPMVNDEVRDTSNHFLLTALQESGLFSALVSEVPADLPAEIPALRATTHLGSPAARAGLREKQFIVSIAGRSVAGELDAYTASFGYAGTQVEIVVDDHGRQRTFTVSREPWRPRD